MGVREVIVDWRGEGGSQVSVRQRRSILWSSKPYKVLQKLRFMVLRSDRRGRADIEVSKDQIVRGRNRTRIDFYVTCQKKQEDEEPTGDMTGNSKLTRRDDGTIEKKDGRNFVKRLMDGAKEDARSEMGKPLAGGGKL